VFDFELFRNELVQTNIRADNSLNLPVFLDFTYDFIELIYKKNTVQKQWILL
jgi:hypothetical protein